MLSKNIVLIGMPGCGKTTIGKILSERLEAKFLDIDKYIEKYNEKSITEIFQQGEEYFRNIERKAVLKISKEKNCVISTGGGVIKNYLNMEDLKKNGIIIFIDRPIESIAKDVNMSNRPLLKQGIENLYNIFEERYELYKKYCDFYIINQGSIKVAVESILEVVI